MKKFIEDSISLVSIEENRGIVADADVQIQKKLSRTEYNNSVDQSGLIVLERTGPRDTTGSRYRPPKLGLFLRLKKRTKRITARLKARW